MIKIILLILAVFVVYLMIEDLVFEANTNNIDLIFKARTHFILCGILILLILKF